MSENVNFELTIEDINILLKNYQSRKLTIDEQQELEDSVRSILSSDADVLNELINAKSENELNDITQKIIESYDEIMLGPEIDLDISIYTLITLLASIRIVHAAGAVINSDCTSMNQIIEDIFNNPSPYIIFILDIESIRRLKKLISQKLQIKEESEVSNEKENTTDNT